MTDEPITLMETRPTRADALKNHDLLLETAARLFAEQGVEAVSMSAVAAAAGVGKGTLYRHFPSKEALCYALLDAEQRELQERTLAYLREQHPPCESLRWFLGAAADFMLRHSDLLMPSDEPLLDHPAHAWWRQTIRGLLIAIRQTNAAKFDVDYTADVLYMMLSARAIHFQTRAMGYSPARITNGLIVTAERLTQ